MIVIIITRSSSAATATITITTPEIDSGSSCGGGAGGSNHVIISNISICTMAPNARLAWSTSRSCKMYVIQSVGLFKALFSLDPLADTATLRLLREDNSFRCQSLSVARYSFIQLSELWQRGMDEITKASKRQQEDSNPGSLDESPTFSRLRFCAPHILRRHIVYKSTLWNNITTSLY